MIGKEEITQRKESIIPSARYTLNTSRAIRIGKLGLDSRKEVTRAVDHHSTSSSRSSRFFYQFVILVDFLVLFYSGQFLIDSIIVKLHHILGSLYYIYEGKPLEKSNLTF